MGQLGEERGPLQRAIMEGGPPCIGLFFPGEREVSVHSELWADRGVSCNTNKAAKVGGGGEGRSKLGIGQVHSKKEK